MADRASVVSRRQVLRITAVAGVSAALGGGLLSELVRRAGLHRVRVTKTRMGTLVTITIVHADAAAAERMIADAFDEMARLEGILSRHRPGTPLARLNARGSLAEAPPELLEVMGRAGEYAGLTGGAFDVTVAPLLALYESSFRSRRVPPDDADIEAARRLVGHERVLIDGSGIVFDTPGMSVTLDGIGKGYVIDRTVDVLVAGGASRVLLDAGGDMASAGADSTDEPWIVGIQDPHVNGETLGVLRLGGECVATSGDYVQTFTEDRRHHHIIDPRTGRSPEHTSSVSVITPTAMDADALSTAAFVLGPKAGLALLEGRVNTEGLVVDKDGRRVATTGF